MFNLLSNLTKKIDSVFNGFDFKELLEFELVRIFRIVFVANERRNRSGIVVRIGGMIVSGSIVNDDVIIWFNFG